MSEPRKDVAYLLDIDGMAKVPSDAVEGHIALFGEDGILSDSGRTAEGLVDESQLQSAVQSAVSSSTSALWDAVKGVDALQAYASDDWAAGESYAAGDFCRHAGGEYAGYKCIEAHTSGQSFDSDKWKGVLTAAGKTAIDGILSGYSKDGLAQLSNLAPQYSPTASYAVNQLVVKEGLLQRCTVGGLGINATFSSVSALDSSVEFVLDALVGHENDTDVHVTTSEKSTWNGKQDAISDLSSIRSEAAAGAAAAERDKIVIGNDSSVTAMHADGTSSVALARLSDVATAESAYVVEEIAALGPGDEGYDPAKYTYNLKDRTVNYVDVDVYDNKEIRLVPPATRTGSGGELFVRDFYVVLKVDSSQDVPVEMPNMALEDYSGEPVSIVAPLGKYVTYRFTDTDKSRSVFLVSLYADPTYKKIAEIERALDDIIAGQGGTDFPTGVYIRDEETGLFHKISAVTDPETGEVNIGIEQHGVYGPGGGGGGGSGTDSSS